MCNPRLYRMVDPQHCVVIRVASIVMAMGTFTAYSRGTANWCIFEFFFVDSSAGTGYVRNSVLSNVRCKYIEAEGCVLINVTAERIVAQPGSIIYNYIQPPGTVMLSGMVTVEA
jgi:hypothetical protein